MNRLAMLKLITKHLPARSLPLLMLAATLSACGPSAPTEPPPLEGAAIGGLLGILAGSALQGNPGYNRPAYYDSGYRGGYRSGGNCNRGYSRGYSNQGDYNQPAYAPDYGYGQNSSYDPYAWQ